MLEGVSMVLVRERQTNQHIGITTTTPPSTTTATATTTPPPPEPPRERRDLLTRLQTL